MSTPFASYSLDHLTAVWEPSWEPCSADGGGRPGTPVDGTAHRSRLSGEAVGHVLAWCARARADAVEGDELIQGECQRSPSGASTSAASCVVTAPQPSAKPSRSWCVRAPASACLTTTW